MLVLRLICDTQLCAMAIPRPSVIALHEPEPTTALQVRAGHACIARLPTHRTPGCGPVRSASRAGPLALPPACPPSPTAACGKRGSSNSSSIGAKRSGKTQDCIR